MKNILFTLIIGLLLLSISQLFSKINKNFSDYDINHSLLYSQNKDFETYDIKENSEIKILSDTLLDLIVIDSLKVLCGHSDCGLSDLTLGFEFLWVISSTNWDNDSVYKVNPKNGTVIEAFQLPGEWRNRTEGIDFDSISPGGPFFWVSMNCYPTSIFKIRYNGFIIDNTFDSPDDSPYGIAFYNDSLWITGARTSSMYVLNILTNEFKSIFPLKYYTNSKDIVVDQFGNLVLWMIDWDYNLGTFGDNNLICKVNPYNGEVIKAYKAPKKRLAGICWENETPGGPFLWVCDYYTDMIYKLKEPDVNSIAVSGRNISRNVLEIFPNPFTATTTIKFNIENYGYVKLSVFNSLGQEVGVLVDGYLPVGSHTAVFDGTGLASGAYFYRMIFGTEVFTGKLLLITNY